MITLKRLRDPLVAAIGALLIAGASVALASSHGDAASPPALNAEDPSGTPDTDTRQEGDQAASDAEGSEPEGAEADEAGTDEQDPDYTGTATIAVDEATLPEDEAAEAEALAALATVGQADAESAALATVSGEVLEAELDDENGFVIWSIEVRDGAGTVHDVAIDAGNGQVLGTQADEDGAED